jgi:hypothetical protein
MKYVQVCGLFLMLVCTSCGGQNKPDLPKDNIKPETKDVLASRWIDTQYEYTDSTGKRLIIQNSGPRGILYTDANGKEYAKATFWTRIINETDNPLELTIDFSGDSYEFPGSVGSSLRSHYKIILPPDTMTRGEEDLFNYGLTDVDHFLNNSIDKPSSLKRTINPKESSGFYVLRLLIKPKSGWQKIKDDGNGTTRAGFSLKGQDLFYTLNGKEIHCGMVNLKNLVLQKYKKTGL